MIQRIGFLRQFEIQKILSEVYIPPKYLPHFEDHAVQGMPNGKAEKAENNNLKSLSRFTKEALKIKPNSRGNTTKNVIHVDTEKKQREGSTANDEVECRVPSRKDKYLPKRLRPDTIAETIHRGLMKLFTSSSPSNLSQKVHHYLSSDNYRILKVELSLGSGACTIYWRKEENSDRNQVKKLDPLKKDVWRQNKSGALFFFSLIQSKENRNNLKSSASFDLSFDRLNWKS